MGLFGPPRKKGITGYELAHDHLQAHFDDVFKHHSHGERERRRAAFNTALEQASDRDPGMPSSEHGVIQRDEFESVVDGLHAGGLISEQEAAQLRSIAEKPLND